jgi:hypothetical protein
VLMLTRPQGIFGHREIWDLPFVKRLLGRRPAATPASPTQVRDDSTPGPKGMA